MFKEKGFVLCKRLKALVDLGFLGIKNEHENSVIPHKSSKKNPLTEEQKAENKSISSARVPIEHKNRHCKIFKICGSRYRGKHKNYENTWLLIASIVNLKQSTRHLCYATFDPN